MVDPSKQMVTDSKGNTNNVMVVEDRVAKCLREVSKTDIKGWNGFKTILSMSLAVAHIFPRSKRREKSCRSQWRQPGPPQGLA